jgi:hypothetical protein
MARFGFGWNNMVDPAMWLLGFVCSVMLENQIQGLVTEGYKMQKWQGWLENASEFFLECYWFVYVLLDWFNALPIAGWF